MVSPVEATLIILATGLRYGDPAEAASLLQGDMEGRLSDLAEGFLAICKHRLA